MLQCALKYAKLGLSVIPLKPKGKDPLVPWLEYQKRCATTEEIVNWWKKNPTGNIGIVTGSISKIAVVGFDGLKGLQKQKELKLESTVSSLTGNGKHLWFEWSEGLRNSASRIA